MRPLILVLLLLCLSRIAAVGCSCDHLPSVPDALQQAVAVFTGRVVELKIATRKEDGRDRSVLECEFDCVEQIKGTVGGSNRRLRIVTDLPNVRCGYSFAIGEEYLVYAYSEGDELWTSMCQRTKPLQVFVREPFNPLIPRFADEPVDDSGKKEADLLKEMKAANQALQTTSVTRSGFGKVSVSDRQRRGV